MLLFFYISNRVMKRVLEKKFQLNIKEYLSLITYTYRFPDSKDQSKKGVFKIVGVLINFFTKQRCFLIKNGLTNQYNKIVPLQEAKIHK